MLAVFQFCRTAVALFERRAQGVRLTPVHHAARLPDGERIADANAASAMGLLGTVPIGLIMRKEKWNSLPAAAKAAFNKLSGEVLARRNGKVNIATQTALEAKTRKNPAHTFVDLTPAAQRKWDATVNPVIDQWVKKHPKGKMLLGALKKELTAIRAGM